MLLKQGRRHSLVQILFQSILFAIEGFFLTALGTHVTRTLAAVLGVFLSRLTLKSLTIISLACGKQSEGPSNTVFSEEGIVSDDEDSVHRLLLEEHARSQRFLLESEASTPPTLAAAGPIFSSATSPTQTSHALGDRAVLLNPLDMETHGYNTDGNAGISRGGQSGSGPLAFQPLKTPSIGYSILTKAIAASALRDPPPPRCASGTRQAILNDLRTWTTNDVSRPILWVYGPGGSGKSALAQTFLQECRYNKGVRLASSFFFSGMTSDRNSDEHFAATISYQLAVNIPETRPIIEKFVEDDPLIFSRTVNVQFAKLVIDPLLQVSKESDPRKFIIIDGLDECDGYDKQRGILDAIYEATLRSHTLPFRFLVVSRPDPHIQDFFNHDNLREISRHIPLSNTDDISTYLEAQLARIQEDRSLPETWLSEKDIAILDERARGLFIYASTILQFIEDSRHYPPARLGVILGITTHSKSPFADLDALYRKILESTSDTKWTLRLMGLLLHLTDKKSASPPFIQHLLGLGAEKFETLLHDVHPLIDVPVDLRAGNPIQMYHSSLKDFLTDRSRSGDYFLDPTVVHSDFTQMCFRVLSPGTVLEGHGAGAFFLV